MSGQKVQNLPQLIEAFKNSAANEALPMAERALAAQCAILARHVIRVEIKNDKLIAELAAIVDERTKTSDAPQQAARNGAGPTPPAPVDGEVEGVEDDIEKIAAGNANDFQSRLAAAQAKAEAKNAAKTQAAAPTESAS